MMGTVGRMWAVMSRMDVYYARNFIYVAAGEIPACIDEMGFDPTSPQDDVSLVLPHAFARSMALCRHENAWALTSVKAPVPEEQRICNRLAEACRAQAASDEEASVELPITLGEAGARAISSQPDDASVDVMARAVLAAFIGVLIGEVDRIALDEMWTRATAAWDLLGADLR